MAYEKQHFADGQPLQAQQLNHMEDGIADALEKVDSIAGDVESALIGQVDGKMDEIYDYIGDNCVHFTQQPYELDESEKDSACQNIGAARDSHVKKKLDRPETAPSVGQILRVTSVNEDGTFTCEWTDAPAGGAVEDVQINGKSIVSAGVATIPMLYGNNHGLVGTSPYRGMKVLSTSIIAPKSPTNDYINSRNESALFDVTDSFAVTLYVLDYAVKNAMCDGKGAAWTDAERLAALLRLGCTVDDNGFVKWSAQEVTA